MSLLVRLLSNGRSLVDLKNSAREYRMRHRNLLPKFGGKKNPFASTTEAGGTAAAVPAAVQVELLKSEAAPVETAAAVQAEAVAVSDVTSAAAAMPVRADEVAAPATVVAKPSAPVIPKPKEPKAPGRTVAWLEKLNPLAWLPRRKGKSVIPKFSRPPVQGELSLDNVKVVRNDLNDADVEVVPAKIVVKTAVNRPARTVGQSVTGREAKPTNQGELVDVQAR